MNFMTSKSWDMTTVSEGGEGDLRAFISVGGIHLDNPRLCAKKFEYQFFSAGVFSMPTWVVGAEVGQSDARASAPLKRFQ